MLSNRAIPLAFFAVLAACSVDVNVESLEQHFSTCPSWACGVNGPSLNNRPFHELSESGAENKEGFRLGALTKNGQTYRIRVTGHTLTAYNRSNTLAGTQLVGSTFTVVDRRGHVVEVYITGVTSLQLWGGPQAGLPIESYRFHWSDPSTGVRLQNLCSNPSPLKAYSSELLGLRGDFTVVFEGNRYDAERKTVLPGSTDWFNIGCAGHALSKLLLTGHANDTGTATTDEQQATLKMITADYCGTGLSFTAGGEPLYWKTSNAYMDYFGTAVTLEARWNAQGAICLGQPRLQVTTNPNAANLPDLELSLNNKDLCPSRPPPCEILDVDKDDGELVRSANPINE
ncbi:MAG: ADYC domain-containing protein [Kofleriaceae bacterium]